ncbi:UvrD-helicase domain-containing protein [Thalassospira lucentensis]|uniref:UvrD-helicase domain-containing protein n=1 Tax=Thalassospira lucentensis TaxID=168935 RepID=UPI00294376D3|nr:UvrD-helicase domain-containing protein [Thalassospira lucentensis]WOI10804.1 UvrD-helicase domain-containing protein [Thalassospira lucentensis]
MVEVSDIIQARRGHVEAPAGCGKTQLIVESVGRETQKPTLILTHTTAGVAALRQRLKLRSVPTSNYRLSTIAGWALKIVAMFPERAGLRHDPLLAPDYPAIQAAVGALCVSGNISRELHATYARLLVDEYQDCSVSQHAIVNGIANAIPTVVFGDPMQAIFGFNANDPLANWRDHVTAAFPLIGQLTVPWRWNNLGANDLGAWLLQAREILREGQSLDLRTCRNRVVWHSIGRDPNALISEQVRVQYEISRQYPTESILFIGDSIQAQSRHNYASRVHGVGVVEPVDFGDVVEFANQMNGQVGQELLRICLAFLSGVMTNVQGKRLLDRIKTIEAKRNRTPATNTELAAIALVNGGGYPHAIAFLEAMRADADRRVYRYSAFNLLLEGLMVATQADKGLVETIAALREQRRHAGRIVPTKAVGSTLLLKGLEAHHAVILDADRPGNAMSRAHLYVALSRGARSIHVFSRSPVLP